VGSGLNPLLLFFVSPARCPAVLLLLLVAAAAEAAATVAGFRTPCRDRI